MISKEDFVGYVNSLLDFYKMTDRLYDATNHAFDLVEVNEASKLIDNQISMLETIMNDDEDRIGEYVCECISFPESAKPAEEMYDELTKE